MTFVGHVLPLAVIAAILVLIVANLSRRALPRFVIPKPRPRPKRSHLRMVKGAEMDSALTDLLKSEERRKD